MGGIKKKLQRLFGGGKPKRGRRDANLSNFAPQDEGLGGSGVTGLGMTEAGTDLGDWGNGAILDELQPPPVPERKDRPQLTTARRDNPILGEPSLEDEGLLPDSSREDDEDDLSGLPTLDLVSQQNVPEPPPPPPPKAPKYGNVAPLGEEYKGEDVRAKWREDKEPGSGESRTEYLRTESERQKRRIEVDDQGRLVKNGELLTTGKVGDDGKRTGGNDLFAMSPEGDMLSSNEFDEQDRLTKEVMPKLDEEAKAFGKGSWKELTNDERRQVLQSGRVQAPYFHHSSYFAGEDLGGVGTIKSREGLIKQINPDSGHHKPKTDHTINTINELKERGANLDHTRVGVHKRDKKGRLKFDDPLDPRHAELEHFHPNEVLESQGNDKTLLGKKKYLNEIERIGEKSKLDKKDDLPQLDEMLYRARGKQDFKEPKRGPEPEKGPEEFTGREWSNPGSGPKGEKKYTDLAPLNDRYRGEHAWARWRTTGNQQQPRENEERPRTAALTDEGRAKRRLHVGDDGLLYNSEGLLLDTIDSGGLIREDMDEGAFIFAMDQTGDILTTDAYEENIQLGKRRNKSTHREGGDKQYFHHSSFFGGRDLAGAGGLRVRDGKAVTLTPNSGHHKSGAKQTLNVFEELRDRGVDMTDLKVDFMTKHDARPDERQLGKKRMQYLSAGAVHEALGTKEDEERAKSEGKQGPTREKAMARLEQQMDLLDEIRTVRYLAGSNDDTRALEKQMIGLMLDGAFEDEVTKHVEKQGFEVFRIDSSIPSIEITDPNVSPLKIKEVSRPENRARFEEQHQKHEGEKQARRKEHNTAKKEGRWYRDVSRLPDWARRKEHEQMAVEDAEFKKLDEAKRAEKLRKQQEEEERKKRVTEDNPYGFNSPYGFDDPNSNDKIEVAPYSYGGGDEVKDDEIEIAPYSFVGGDEVKDEVEEPLVFDEKKQEIVEQEKFVEEKVLVGGDLDDEDKDDDTDSSSSDDEDYVPPTKRQVTYNYND